MANTSFESPVIWDILPEDQGDLLKTEFTLILLGIFLMRVISRQLYHRRTMLLWCAIFFLAGNLLFAIFEMDAFIEDNMAEIEAVLEKMASGLRKAVSYFCGILIMLAAGFLYTDTVLAITVKVFEYIDTAVQARNGDVETANNYPDEVKNFTAVRYYTGPPPAYRDCNPEGICMVGHLTRNPRVQQM